MQYKIIKLYFHTGMHIGNGMLTDGNPVFYADTLFSALCHEALYMPGGVERLYQTFYQGKLRISDAMPYIHKEYYVPKPMVNIHFDDADSKKKKAFKKLKYIPIQKLDEYLAGNLNPVVEEKRCSTVGTYKMRTSVKINRDGDPEPFHIGVYHFQENAGLYICVSYQQKEDFEYLMEIFDALCLTGIGGKRSAGLGKFNIMPIECPQILKKRLCEDSSYRNYISLSLTIPQKDEMEAACQDASYLLRRRGGFISSTAYSEEFQKKQAMYVFESGSVFKNKFAGDIFDVSVKEGGHPVYRYAYPLFMGVMRYE